MPEEHEHICAGDTNRLNALWEAIREYKTVRIDHVVPNSDPGFCLLWVPCKDTDGEEVLADGFNFNECLDNLIAKQQEKTA